MHFFTEKFKFKFTNSAIKQQCKFILQSFTDYSQCEIVKIEVKVIKSFCNKHKFEKLKKFKNSQSNAAWYCLKVCCN